MAMPEKFYKGVRYWESETPEIADAGKIRIAYYPKAGKLHFSIMYRTFEDGEIRTGKTIVIDEEQVKLNPEFGALLQKVLEEWS